MADKSGKEGGREGRGRRERKGRKEREGGVHTAAHTIASGGARSSETPNTVYIIFIETTTSTQPLFTFE